jgi:hypothetical protein
MYCNSLLEAPTVELTHRMQGVIVDWLKSKKEDVAANWFETNRTGEHGNYTNATAGYVGNNKSAGIESHWKYMCRDTVGVAGSGKRTGLKTFILMRIKYLSDLSKRHDDKILCPITGAHRFPSLPVISAKMWAKVGTFDVKRLLLSRTDRGTKSSAWEADLEFFDEI